MAKTPLTIILPVTANSQNRLEALLGEIREDPSLNKRLPLATVGSVHFARLVLIQGKDMPCRLLFSACHDGDRLAVVQELSRSVGPGLDAVFGCCDGYSSGTWQSAQAASAFVTQHHLTASTSVAAFPGVTVEEIHGAMQLRKHLESLLDSPSGKASVAVLFPKGLDLSPEANNEGIFAKMLGSILDFVMGRRLPQTQKSVVKTHDAFTNAEDRMAQNQMTIVSPNKPGIHLLTLRLVLWAAQLRSNAGNSLSSLPTIHFAQWTIIDDGANLLFQSNYNGSWENYIDDFIDYAHTALDAIWGHCPDFPEGGCRDVEAFKKIIRKYQHPAQVYYSAYPNSTVAHLAEDLSIQKVCRSLSDSTTMKRLIAGTHTPVPEWSR